MDRRILFAGGAAGALLVVAVCRKGRLAGIWNKARESLEYMAAYDALSRRIAAEGVERNG